MYDSARSTAGDHTFRAQVDAYPTSLPGSPGASITQRSLAGLWLGRVIYMRWVSSEVSSPSWSVSSTSLNSSTGLASPLLDRSDGS